MLYLTVTVFVSYFSFCAFSGCSAQMRMRFSCLPLTDAPSCNSIPFALPLEKPTPPREAADKLDSSLNMTYISAFNRHRFERL